MSAYDDAVNAIAINPRKVAFINLNIFFPLYWLIIRISREFKHIEKVV